MEKKVRILPEYIANQIAAGEVVQRPESVVKELVENSIDAKANSIAVIVKNAGKSLIHVVDNGIGMTKEDLLLSIKRHATSKIYNSEDLEAIKTFGFRGEALASICSVAFTEIRTKQNNAEIGWQLKSEPLKEPVIEPFNAENGTQVFVRNLFYNVPARRKFLKADLTEFRYISETMMRFALSHPDIRFTFYDDNILVFDLKPSNILKRIDEIFGKNIIDNLFEINYSDEFISLSGFVGTPALARNNRGNQFLFLNKRTIYSPLLSYAVNSCFENLIDGNQKPFFIINLQIDYSKVDVNIHPQKHEVKFEDEKYIFNTIKSVVNNSLFKHNLIPQLNNFDIEQPFILIKENDEKLLVNQQTGEIIKKKNENNGFRYDYNGFNFETNYQSTAKQKEFQSNVEILNKKIDISNQLINTDNYYYFQLFNKFILKYNDDYIYIYEQSSMHKRIIYEQLKKQKQLINSQNLLFPITIQINISDKDFLQENTEILNNSGIYFEILDNTLNITEIPNIIKQGLESEIINNIFQKLFELPLVSNFDIYENIILILCDELSIKNGQKLEVEEMKKLIEELHKCENSMVSPFGKRTHALLNKDEFYQKFLRF